LRRESSRWVTRALEESVSRVVWRLENESSFLRRPTSGPKIEYVSSKNYE